MAGKGARILLTVMVTVLVLVDLVGCCYMWVDEIKQRTKTTDIKVDIPPGFQRGEVIFLFLFFAPDIKIRSVLSIIIQMGRYCLGITRITAKYRNPAKKEAFSLKTYYD